jgi:hypothetical protein
LQEHEDAGFANLSGAMDHNDVICGDELIDLIDYSPLEDIQELLLFYDISLFYIRYNY